MPDKRLRRMAVTAGAALAIGLGMGTPAASATAATSAAEPASLPPGTITVQFPGTTPLGTFVDPATGTAYVQTSDDVLHAIDIATGTATAAIPLGFAITGDAIDPATGTIYLGSDQGAAEKIAVVDGTTGTVTRTIRLPNGYGPDSLAFDPSSGLLYAGMVHNGVIAIDPSSGAITATIGLFQTWWDSTFIALDAQHHQLYAVPFGGPALVIDTTTNSVTRSFPASGAGQANVVSPSLSGDGSILYISRGSAVASYATGTGQNIGQTFFGGSEGSGSEAVDSTPGVLYQVVFTAFNNSEQLYVAQVNSKATAVTGTIPLPGEGPAGEWIALNPQTETLVYAGTPAAPASWDNTQVLLIPLTGTGAITSPSAATFTTGEASTFAVKAAGTPAPTFSESPLCQTRVRQDEPVNISA
jgi:DNA-binding beta-propeller fold protein YncE